MTVERDRVRIRLGMVAFLLSGLLTIIGLWLRGPNPVDGHSLDAAAFVRVSLQPTHNLTWALLLTNLTLQIYAWIALWAFLRDSREEGLAFWGMVLSIAGNALFLPIAGIIALTAPMVAGLYAAGNTAAGHCRGGDLRTPRLATSDRLGLCAARRSLAHRPCHLAIALAAKLGRAALRSSCPLPHFLRAGALRAGVQRWAAPSCQRHRHRCRSLAAHG
jgi:hypothetical protein